MERVVGSIFMPRASNIKKYGEEQKTTMDMQQQTSVEPNCMLTTSLVCRVVRCVGKVLFGLFTVPFIGAVEMLGGSMVGGIVGSSRVLKCSCKKSKILGGIMMFAVVPMVAVTCGLLCGLIGFYSGVKDGIKIAKTCSMDAFKANFWKEADRLK